MSSRANYDVAGHGLFVNKHEYGIKTNIIS